MFLTLEQGVKFTNTFFQLMLLVIQFLVGISQESYNFVNYTCYVVIKFMCLPIIVIKVCLKLSFIDLSC